MRFVAAVPTLMVAVLVAVLASGCAETNPADPFQGSSPSFSRAPAGALDDVPPRSEDFGAVWAELSDDSLWAYVAARDSMIVVGLKKPGARRGVWRSRILIPGADRGAAVVQLRRFRDAEVVEVDTLLPVAKVKVTSVSAIRALRRFPFADYVEPAAIGIHYSSGASGCGWESWSGTPDRIASGDYIPPNFTRGDADIEIAWNRSRGDGVVIGLADTGIQSTQAQLREHFATGASSGRWHSYHGLGGHPWYATGCSHGTRMAAAMVAPRDGRNMVGVAWRANFISVHQADNVWHVDPPDVAVAVRDAASFNQDNYPSRRIVTMAFRADNGSNRLSDEIRFWHDHGRLFIAASGSVDLAGVYFPASMPEVMAVSAVGPGYEPIEGFLGVSGVNYGDKVEVSFVDMQLSAGRNESELNSLSVTSGATAIVSGIAALVWSAFPNETNEQIRDRLRRAGHQYPSHDRVLGYGIVSAMKALGGFHKVTIKRTWVSGGGFNQVATYDLEAMPEGGEGPYSYEWSTGATTKTIRISIGPGDPVFHYEVTVSEPDPYGITSNSSSIDIDPPPGGCDDPTKLVC
ncbi:MAG TPA: S8/S53 family peptidase [Longimicrobiales bacterium]